MQMTRYAKQRITLVKSNQPSPAPQAQPQRSQLQPLQIVVPIGALHPLPLDQPLPSQQDLPSPSFGFEAYVLRGANHKHGRGSRRQWGKQQWAQWIILTKYPKALKERVNHSRLTLNINKQLVRDPNYRLGKITRPAVIEALRMAREANR
jgi:hypothetical protein